MRTSDQATRRQWLRSITQDIALFIALLATAIALGAALAHAFTLPNKIGLSADEYLIAQKSYRGWDRLGYVLLIQLVAMLAVALLAGRERNVRVPALFAILSLAIAQSMFWLFTYPANVATQNWTVIPQDWENLRWQWEYSHAVGAAFQLLAMSCLIVAALSRGR